MSATSIGSSSGSGQSVTTTCFERYGMITALAVFTLAAFALAIATQCGAIGGGTGGTIAFYVMGGVLAIATLTLFYCIPRVVAAPELEPAPPPSPPEEVGPLVPFNDEQSYGIAHDRLCLYENGVRTDKTLPLIRLDNKEACRHIGPHLTAKKALCLFPDGKLEYVSINAGGSGHLFYEDVDFSPAMVRDFFNHPEEFTEHLWILEAGMHVRDKVVYTYHDADFRIYAPAQEGHYASIGRLPVYRGNLPEANINEVREHFGGFYGISDENENVHIWHLPREGSQATESNLRPAFEYLSSKLHER